MNRTAAQKPDLRSLSGPQLRLVLEAARTLRGPSREPFLQAVALALADCRELGDGRRRSRHTIGARRTAAVHLAQRSANDETIRSFGGEATSNDACDTSINTTGRGGCDGPSRSDGIPRGRFICIRTAPVQKLRGAKPCTGYRDLLRKDHTMTPPKHLSAAMRSWWQSVTKSFALEPHHLLLLERACCAWDRAEQAREILARDGLTHVFGGGDH